MHERTKTLFLRMLLEINQLSKSYGAQPAISDITLQLDRGEIIGLLGPNGAGKSTLMKCIAGVLRADGGTIIFDNQAVDADQTAYKHQIGFLPENNPLYLDMYVREYLEFVCDLRNLPYHHIGEVIDLVGITPEKNKKIGQLSKGYRQRVGLAQAIIHQPSLLILDEPTNGLDPNQILEIRDVIRQAGQGKSVLLSTHLMQEVEALCHRVILINGGKIIIDTAVEDFRGKFASLEEAFAHYTVSKK